MKDERWFFPKIKTHYGGSEKSTANTVSNNLNNQFINDVSRRLFSCTIIEGEHVGSRRILMLIPIQFIA